MIGNHDQEIFLTISEEPELSVTAGPYSLGHAELYATNYKALHRLAFPLHEESFRGTLVKRFR